MGKINHAISQALQLQTSAQDDPTGEHSPALSSSVSGRVLTAAASTAAAESSASAAARYTLV